jgi:Pectate lyase superfamily protein
MKNLTTASRLSRLGLVVFCISLTILAAADVANADCLDVRDYGALADGKHDDTMAIQTAIQSATTALRRGGTVCIPAGDYRITRTITVDSVMGIRLMGDGGSTRLVWDGDDRSPLLLLSSVQNAEIHGFEIIALASRPLDVAIQCITRSGATLASKHNMFVNLRINGVTRGIRKGFQIGGGGVDANNDFHVFENCTVENYSNVAYSIENTEVYGLLFINCLFMGNEGGQIGVATNQYAGRGGNFSWVGGGGGNNQIADFYIGVPNSGPISIANAVFERSARFLKTDGPSGVSGMVEVAGIRWSGDALATDGVAIDFRFAGPLIIRNSRIGEDRTKALKISWSPGGPPESGVFVFEGNAVRRAPGSSLFVGRQPTRDADNVAF